MNNHFTDFLRRAFLRRSPLPAPTLAEKESPRSCSALIRRILLILLVMAAPFIVAFVLTWLGGFNMFRSIPVFSDEEWWWLQYSDISEYGKPLGYIGFQGYHASVGTWGPWGMYPTLLTGLFTRIFGWGTHAFVIYNICYIAFASLIFILLTEPQTRDLWKLALTNALAYVTICYLLICMNESVRYAMSLVLGGIMYRMIKKPDVSRWRFILRCTVVPLLIIYATAFYQILAVYMLVYLFIMLRRLNLVIRSAGTVGVTVILFRFIKHINHVTCSPYISGETSYTLPTFRLRLTDSYFDYLGNTKLADPFYLLFSTDTTASATDAFHVFYCALVYLLIGLLIWHIIHQLRNLKNIPDRTSIYVDCLCLLLVAGFWGGHILFYNTTAWTYMRGVNSAVYPCMMLLALQKGKGKQPWNIAIIYNALGFILFIEVFNAQFAYADHFSQQFQEDMWAAEKDTISQIIVPDADAEDPWTNTVTVYETGSDVYMVLPCGVGVETDEPDTISTDSHYVITGYTEGEEGYDDTVDTLSANGYEIVYADSTYTIFENTSRAYN